MINQTSVQFKVVYLFVAGFLNRMAWTSLHLRDAIVAVYKGEVEPRDIPKRFGGVSRQHATELAARVPEGLIDDDERRQVTRVANGLAEYEMRSCYTNWELQEAVYQYKMKKKKPSVCVAEYGVAESTLRKKRQEIDAAAGQTPSAKKMKKIVSTLTKEPPGP